MTTGLSIEAENAQLWRRTASLERIVDDAVLAHENQVECTEMWQGRAEALRRRVEHLEDELERIRKELDDMLSRTISSS